MFHCPVGVWVIEQRAIILSATVRTPTVKKYRTKKNIFFVVGKGYVVGYHEDCRQFDALLWYLSILTRWLEGDSK